MSRVRLLLDAYERRVQLPWQQGLSGREKVWFCIYEPRDERRLRMHLPEFERVTRKAGRQWGSAFDLATKFEAWLASQEYKESYFEEPELLGPALDDFRNQTVTELRVLLSSADEDSVTPVIGVGSLFGISSVSKLIEQVTESIRGRLLVFFPGSRDESNYRLLDARDGWNYLAVPIEAEEG
jgi:hypothetical protein